MAIVVGSGAGGATVAKELAASGHKVLLIEKGPEIAEKDAHRYYANVDTGGEADADMLPGRHHHGLCR